jgi:MFS family permease
MKEFLVDRLLYSFVRIFKPLQPIPPDLKRNFLHLYFDIGWYGVLSGTSLAFLSIYATRIHASGQQIGLISAGPAVMNLLFTLPAGMLLNKFSVNKTVFWASVLNRIFYASWIFLPIFVPDQTSIWLLILSTLVMNIPGAVMSVGFTVFFGEAVPPEWRSTVAGTRNAVIGLVTMISTLVSGQILNRFSMETGYAIVFGVGFLGAAMSSYHLFKIKPVKIPQLSEPAKEISEIVKPQKKINLSVLRGKFGWVVGLLFFFHLFQFLPAAIFPVFLINHLGLNEQSVSIGSTLFFFTQFIISLRLSNLVRRSNNLRVLGIGMILYGFYPLFLPIAANPLIFYLVSAVGGFAMGMLGGVILNYLLERMADSDRPAHMVLYNLSLNTAILGGSMLGPALADWYGFIPALVFIAIGRSLVGVAILRWG